MNKLVCFDLMDTLVYPPKKELLLHWINQQNITITEFQKEMYLKGFPYAVFFENDKHFKIKRDLLLCTTLNEIKDISKVLSVPVNSQDIVLTDSYITLFNQNCRIDNGMLKLLRKWKGKANLKLVSNLYTPYKSLIKYHQLESCFDDILLSCEIGVQKPNCAIFDQTDFYNYKEKIFIGDNWHSDIINPLKLGFKCYYINPNDQFIMTIFQKGIAFLIEKEGNYKVKEKYAEITSYYLKTLININKIEIDDLEIIDNLLYFKFMKNVRIIENIRNICSMEGVI